MGKGLKDEWGVSDPAKAGSDQQSQQFQASFKTEITAISGHLQYTATNAEVGRHDPLAARRDALYAAFQSALGQIDPANPAKAQGAIDKVFADTKTLNGEATALHKEAEKAFNGWQSRQPKLDTAVESVEELEVWGDAKATPLRMLMDGVRKETDKRRYAPASTTLDQVLPKLQTIYDAYLKQKEAKEKYEPVSGVLQPRIGDASQSRHAKLAPMQQATVAVQTQMETAAQSNDFVGGATSGLAAGAQAVRKEGLTRDGKFDNTSDDVGGSFAKSNVVGTGPDGSTSRTTAPVLQTSTMSAAPADEPPGGDAPESEPLKTSGAVTSKVKTSADNLVRIKELSEWEKKNKVTGDVAGLQKRLRLNEPDAEAEYRDAKDAIENDKKPYHVEESHQGRRQTPATSTRISTANKRELEDSKALKELLPDEEDRRKFMAWRKEGNKKGGSEDGLELKKADDPKVTKGSKPSRGPKERVGHDHLEPYRGSSELAKQVGEWQEEQPTKKKGTPATPPSPTTTYDDPSKPKGGKGGSGSGGAAPGGSGGGNPQSGNGGGSNTSSRTGPANPATPPTPAKSPPAPAGTKPPVKATIAATAPTKPTKVGPAAIPSPPKVTPKSPNVATPGGKVASRHVPNLPTTGPVYARLKPALKALRGVGAKFLGSAGRVATTVKVPLSMASDLLTAIQFIEMTESAVRGEGFIFTQQIAQSESLGKGVNALVKAYEDSHLHQDLSDMVVKARKIDAEDPDGLYGSDMLSDYCVKARSVVSDHKTDCEKLLDHLTTIDSDVSARFTYASTLFNDNTFAVAVAIATLSSATHAELFAAIRDLQRILSALSPAKYALEPHLKIVRGDMEVIEANIIERMPIGITTVDD